MGHLCRTLHRATATLAKLMLIVSIATANPRGANAQNNANLAASDRWSSSPERPGLKSPKLPFTFFREDTAATPRVNESEPAPPQRPESEDARLTADVLLSPESPEPPARLETTRPEAQPAPTRSVWRIYLEPEPAADANDAPQLAPPQPASPAPTSDATAVPRPVALSDSEAPPLSPKITAGTKQPGTPVAMPGPRSQASPGVAQGSLIEAKMRWANASVRSACDLGERRLLYSTRATLQDALYQIAQSLDEAAGTKQHAASLDAAWETLREADDFFPRHSGLPFATDTTRVAARHSSPAACSLPPDSSSGQAIRHYYGFAKEQLTAAFAEVPAASGALWGLGKAYVEFSREPDRLVVNGQGKALLFQEAAVAIDPANWRAANELGVLLARAGRWQDAAIALRKSLINQGTPEGWHNLAVVSEQLGQSQEARDARQRSTAMGYRPDRNDKPTVEWVPPTTLGVTAGPARSAAAGGAKANESAGAAPSDSNDASPRQTTARRLFDWLPW